MNFVKSYLHGRYQATQVDDSLSMPRHQSEKVGVPQGSILGPLLFMIYIIDFCNSSDGGSLNIMFADDTGSTVVGESIDDLKQKIKGVLTALVQWLQGNRLSLNVAKIKSQGLQPHFIEPIEFDKVSVEGLNISMQRVSSIRYLGAEIDYNLSFKGHLGRLRIKAAQGVGIMHRLQHFFPYEILRLLYFSLVHSHYHIVLLLILAIFETNLKSLQIVQNQALRILQCFLKLSMTVKCSQFIFSPLICLGERANFIVMRLGIRTRVFLLDLKRGDREFHQGTW